MRSLRYSIWDSGAPVLRQLRDGIRIPPRGIGEPLGESLTLRAGLLLWFYRDPHARYGSAGETGMTGGGQRSAQSRCAWGESFPQRSQNGIYGRYPPGGVRAAAVRRNALSC